MLKPLDFVLADVPRETIDQLQRFEAELIRWAGSINLVSLGSVADLWTRHIVDSLQLLSALPKECNVAADIGSGAGFPGIVMSIARPDTRFHLIEKDRKKSAFLRHVIGLLHLNAEVHAERCETIPAFHCDIVLSRACAPLSQLLDLTSAFHSPETICLFPKGRGYSTELKEARQGWRFDTEMFQSVTKTDSVILSLRNIERV